MEEIEKEEKKEEEEEEGRGEGGGEKQQTRRGVERRKKQDTDRLIVTISVHHKSWPTNRHSQPSPESSGPDPWPRPPSTQSVSPPASGKYGLGEPSTRAAWSLVCVARHSGARGRREECIGLVLPCG